MSMDTAFGAKRRQLIRSTWMTYHNVWAPSRRSRGVSGGVRSAPPSTVLVKFVLGRMQKHQFQFTTQLESEARNTSHLADIVALSWRERKSSMGKADSSKYGLWGLDAMLSTAFKSFVWRRLAIARYATLFVAKADDDVFINVPEYIRTLQALPIRSTSWGLHALAERQPGHANTSFPYCLGPLSTTSADLAQVSTSSPIASFLSQPYNGRPSEYFTQRCDHEDYASYSALDDAKTPMHIFHDCRFVEPFLQGELFNKPSPLTSAALLSHTTANIPHRTRLRDAGKGRGSAHDFSPKSLSPAHYVNLHKLDKTLFSAARSWFPDDADDTHTGGSRTESSLRVAEKRELMFVQHTSPVLPQRYQWHSTPDALANRCGPLFVANYHTRWGELGPMKFYLRREGELHPCPFQDLKSVTSPLLLALGVWTSGPAERIAIRRMLRDAPGVWSWHNRTLFASSHPAVLVRFPVLQPRPISLDAYWECHRYQDMLSINTKWNFGPLQGGQHERERYMWAVVAKRLYPTAAFIGVLPHQGGGGMLMLSPALFADSISSMLQHPYEHNATTQGKLATPPRHHACGWRRGTLPASACSASAGAEGMIIGCELLWTVRSGAGANCMTALLTPHG